MNTTFNAISFESFVGKAIALQVNGQIVGGSINFDSPIVGGPNPTKGNFLDDFLFAGVVPSSGNVWILGSEDEGTGVGFGTLAIHTTTGD